MLSSSGSISQPYEYVGREGYYREEFDLYLLGQRWYDSEVGRFISRDPIGEKGGINLYEYVRNNSLNNIDPFGLGERCDRFKCQPRIDTCQDCCDELCEGMRGREIPGVIDCRQICYDICVRMPRNIDEIRKKIRERRYRK